MAIVHRDIKGRNILLSLNGDRGTLCLKLADFGCSVQTKDDRVPAFGGTVHWMAPELFSRSKRVDIEALWTVDIWALGITAIEMVTAHPMMHKKTPSEFVKFIKLDLQRFMEFIPVTDSDALDMLIRKCLSIDPQRRPTAEQMLRNDAFIATPINSDEEHLEALCIEHEMKRKYDQKMCSIESMKRRCAKW